MKVQFDFYVGYPYASSETGAWEVKSVTRKTSWGMEYVDTEDIEGAESQLRKELDAANDDYIFIHYAGHSDVTEYEEEENI